MFASSFSGLLSNLTRLTEGVDALVGQNVDEASGATAEFVLLKLSNRLDAIPNVLWMANACASAKGRDILLLRGNPHASGRSIDQQPLTRLLQLYHSRKVEPATRLAVASAIRNCAIAEDCHDVLANATNALDVCLSCLVSPKTQIDPNYIKDASDHVRAIVANHTTAEPEQSDSIRLVVVEALLLMCKSEIGVTSLREKDVFLILFEWSKQEKNNEISSVLSNVMHRITAVDAPSEPDAGVLTTP